MSALATAGIRCSGGLPALQEYVLSCYAKDQQRQCDLVYGGRAVRMGDHQQLNTDHEGIDSHHVTQANTPSPHSVHWQKLGASVLLQLKGAITSPPDQQRRNTALASPVSVAPGGVAALSKSNKNRAKVSRSPSASPPRRAAATATTSAAISPRVATHLGSASGATAMPSSSATAAYVTPRSLSLSQQNNNNNNLLLLLCCLVSYHSG
ncbi:Hypothetical protein, putative [Bodo saltans]|uniref:Uncharacterized protein n=1 Tax=Bodo saltans TaxID=75058 RepID=A0A0S4KK79_BODSA|nr:Hypothetical protein, putative [Bodo saltans]|eukprot:CUI15390.1 Hypothetical protein, putative [Bodo saltans]